MTNPSHEQFLALIPADEIQDRATFEALRMEVYRSGGHERSEQLTELAQGADLGQGEASMTVFDAADALAHEPDALARARRDEAALLAGGLTAYRVVMADDRVKDIFSVSPPREGWLPDADSVELQRQRMSRVPWGRPNNTFYVGDWLQTTHRMAAHYQKRKAARQMRVGQS